MSRIDWSDLPIGPAVAYRGIASGCLLPATAMR